MRIQRVEVLVSCRGHIEHAINDIQGAGRALADAVAPVDGAIAWAEGQQRAILQTCIEDRPGWRWRADGAGRRGWCRWGGSGCRRCNGCGRCGCFGWESCSVFCAASGSCQQREEQYCPEQAFLHGHLLPKDLST